MTISIHAPTTSPTSGSDRCRAARSNPSAPSALTTPFIPQYRVHSAKKLGYVRFGERVLYLGKVHSPESYGQYRRVIAEWLATGQPPRRPGNVAPLNVATLVERHRNWARGHYVDGDGRPSSGLGPVEAAGTAVIALYGPTPAASFGPVALRAVRQWLIAKGLSRSVVNQRLSCVKRIFRWAVAEELVPPAVVQGLGAVGPLLAGRSGVRETRPVVPVPDIDVEVVLRFLPPTIRAMVLLQRISGMRSGELCLMRTCDIDLGSTIWLYRPSSHKNAHRGHKRVVYLGPRAQSMLGPLLRPDDPTAYLFSPVQVRGERRLLRQRQAAEGVATLRSPSEFQSNKIAGDDGRRKYDTRSYRRALRYGMQAAVRAGAMTAEQHWFPHQLRHRHATSVSETRGLEAARVSLGHRQLNQTRLYAAADHALALAIAQDLA